VEKGDLEDWILVLIWDVFCIGNFHKETEFSRLHTI